MSGEIEVPETPNWLNDLEAKRELRLKVKLGHEAGAGAPCLKCGDKCPGLDLHFWRKACKICRCPKEEHDVPDDDIYGWAQFQLLGSKPNKIKTKIVLPGKKDEVELDWTPKGQKDTIDKYLKTLPPETLPIKGSQAAQERKQLLQKQIPVHDIDPTLCHELNEDEVAKMEEYIGHIKKSAVGVGQIVNLSSIIKANLHCINPHEAHIIASRYAKGVPFSEIVKLQSGLAQNLENLSLKGPKKGRNHNALPMMHANTLPANISEEKLQGSQPMTKFKDITHPLYDNSSSITGKGVLSNSRNLQPRQKSDFAIDHTLPSKTNFDPTKTPSQFLGYHQAGQGYDVPKYGYENPYFNQVQTSTLDSEQRHPTVPKSVKDLIYSTYDPHNGPIPQDGNIRNESQFPDYNPNHAVLSTYKHNPKLTQQEALIKPDKQDPALPLLANTGEKHSSNINQDTNRYIPNKDSSHLNDDESVSNVMDIRNRFETHPNNPMKYRKPLNKLHPDNKNIAEYCLEPSAVNVGAIQDINPEIKMATTESNPGYDDNSNIGVEYSPESIREILNNIKLPDCHYCKKPFDENEFAVTIDRAQVLFHAQCFKCAGCNQSLADNIYFYHKESNNVYCGRDFAKIKGYPRCSACDELIFTKEYCLAENSTFHLKHFCCFQCDSPLAGQDYTLEDDKPYCLPCFESSKAAKCSTCGNVIKPDEAGCQLNGVHFHAEDKCFRCIVCSVPLMGKRLLLRNEKLYCSHECFNSVN